MSEAGFGKSYKPFSVMLRKEDAFNFESSNVAFTTAYADGTADQAPANRRTTAVSRDLEAVSGPIGEPPTLNSKNNSGQVKKHNVIAENYKVLKLVEESEFSYTYSVENYKGLYHLMGGVIDYPYELTVGSTAEFSDDEDVLIYGGGSATNYLIGEVDSIPESGTIRLKQWTRGENLAIYVYNATGSDLTTVDAKLLMIKGNEMYFDPSTDLPDQSETAATYYADGRTSGARVEFVQPRRLKCTITANAGIVVGQSVTATGSGIVTHVTSDTIEIYQTSSTDIATGTLTGSGINTNTATISAIKVLSAEIRVPAVSDNIVDTEAESSSEDTSITAISYRHLIFPYKSPPHYSLMMHYEALDNQYLMTGAVCNEFGFELATNDVPKANQAWNVALTDFDATKDPEPTNSDTDLYEYTDLTQFLLNSVDYSDVFKTIGFTASRDMIPYYGNKRFAKGMIQPEISMSLTCGILREDKALVNLRIANTSLDGKVTLRRGSAGNDECIMYFDSTNVGASAKLRLFEVPESEDDGKIFHELTFQIEGLPAFEVFDSTQYYG